MNADTNIKRIIGVENGERCQCGQRFTRLAVLRKKALDQKSLYYWCPSCDEGKLRV